LCTFTERNSLLNISAYHLRFVFSDMIRIVISLKKIAVSNLSLYAVVSKKIYVTRVLCNVAEYYFIAYCKIDSFTNEKFFFRLQFAEMESCVILEILRIYALIHMNLHIKICVLYRYYVTIHVV